MSHIHAERLVRWFAGHDVEYASIVQKYREEGWPSGLVFSLIATVIESRTEAHG